MFCFLSIAHVDSDDFSASKFCKNAGADDVCRRSVGGGNIPESGAALQAPFQSWKTPGNNPRIGNFITIKIYQNSHVCSFNSDWFWTPAVDLMVLPPVILFWAKPGQTALERLGGGKGCLHQAAMTYRSLQFLYSLLVCWPFPTFSSLFVAGFHDANRLKRHWRCINLWDWNTLMNLDALCISFVSYHFASGKSGNVAQSRSSQELLGLVNDSRQLGMWNQSTPGCDPRRGAEWWTLSWFMAVCICKDRFIYIINNL